MSKIECYSNWGYWDRLDSKVIENGEKLHVVFPSGKLILVRAYVVTTELQVMDHGHACNVSDVRSYWKTSIEGIDVLVPLVGLEAQRIQQ